MATLAPLADVSSFLFPIEQIVIPPDRQREKAEPDQGLIDSIREQGLIQPIVIKKDGTLVAGERRLRAHLHLNLAHIRATVFEDLPPLQAFLVELIENIQRKQLSWQEETAAVYTYHNMRLDQFPAWTARGTAGDLGFTDNWVSRQLAVGAELADPNVRDCPTFQGAFNYLTAKADRARIAAHSRGIEIAGAAHSLKIPPIIPINATKEEKTQALLAHMNLKENVVETLEDLDDALTNISAGKIAAAALEQQRKTEIVNDIILHDDFLAWAEEYAGPKFDVLHVDFPYGKGYSGARTRKTKEHIAPIYRDDPDIYFALVEGLLQLQDNFTFPAAHCIFWFDMMYYDWTVKQFEAAGWKAAQPYPLIWTKGYSGIASDVRRRPRHCYETALLFSRGDRKIARLEKDHFECALDPEKLHLNQKPLEMLKHFLGLVVDEHSAVLDPTCGSGTALAAAGQLGAARILGVELDESNASVARFLLQRYHPGATNAPAPEDVHPAEELPPIQDSSAPR